MNVNECMTIEPRIVSPDQSISKAARVMEDMDIGFLPVGDGDRLVGVITDRDITVRAVAYGCDGKTPIREVMSHEVLYCYVDDDIGEVLDNMGELQLRRMPVLTHEKRLIGVVSIGDIAQFANQARTGEALHEISGRAD